MKITLLIFIISVLIINFSFAQNVNHAEMDDQENCQKCHYCNQPTKKDPCLRSCPRTKVVTSQQMKEETPHVLVLDLLSDMYVPVVFSHKLHAEMADMAGGCGLCHHYNPEGAILSLSAMSFKFAKTYKSEPTFSQRSLSPSMPGMPS